MRGRTCLRALSSQLKATAAARQLSKEEIRDLLNIEPAPALPPASTPEQPRSVFDVQPSLLHDITAFYEQTGDLAALNAKFGTRITAFRYGLPLPNIDPAFKSLDAMQTELNPPQNTPLENLYSALGLDRHSSFEEYQQRLQARYGFAALLGEEELSPAERERFELLCVPHAKLQDARYMQWVRRTYAVNPSLPGCLEVEDVNRFVPDLRPVEDFPHTPIVPISDKQMKRFRDERRRRNERQFFSHFTPEKFFAFGMFLATGGAVFLLVRLALKKEEDMLMRYQQKKLSRLERSGRSEF